MYAIRSYYGYLVHADEIWPGQGDRNQDFVGAATLLGAGGSEHEGAGLDTSQDAALRRLDIHLQLRPRDVCP